MTHGEERSAAAKGARTNAEWIRALGSHDESQAAALADLRALLVRTSRYAVIRSGRMRDAGSATVDQIAEDCAQEALVAILRRLEDFRGDSRFTTWACKFAINIALVATRRHAWKHVSLDALLEAAAHRPWPGVADHAPDPDRRIRRAEAWALVQDVIEHQLTARQRQALTALVLDEVPLDELVRHWQSNRNAVYKLVHDARRRLKACVEARGFSADELVALFESPGKVGVAPDTKGK